MPDPLIKPAMDEIKEVLARHDMAALMFVSSRTSIEFRYRLDPSWSCIRHEANDGIRIRAKSGDPAQQEALRLSVGTIAAFSDCLRQAGGHMDHVLEKLSSYVEMTHRTRDEPPPPKAEPRPGTVMLGMFDTWARSVHGADYKTKLPQFQLQETERAFVCGFASYFLFAIQVAELSEEEGTKRLNQVQDEIKDYMKLIRNVPDDLTSQ